MYDNFRALEERKANGRHGGGGGTGHFRSYQALKLTLEAAKKRPQGEKGVQKRRQSMVTLQCAVHVSRSLQVRDQERAGFPYLCSHVKKKIKEETNNTNY